MNQQKTKTTSDVRVTASLKSEISGNVQGDDRNGRKRIHHSEWESEIRLGFAPAEFGRHHVWAYRRVYGGVVKVIKTAGRKVVF
jgi:hypothetical protein